MAEQIPIATADRNGRRDPTGNTSNLVAASARAQADLRDADNKYYDAEIRAVKEIVLLRAEHAKEMRASEVTISRMREDYQEKNARAEAGRLNSIRQVDREEVAKTAVAANTAILTLAKQTGELQQTLAKQVTDTATVQESRSSAQNSETNKRLSALELTSSEGKGKQSVADPQLVQSMNDIRELLVSQSKNSGKSEGIGLVWVVALGLVTMLSMIFGMGAVVYEATHASSTPPPQVIYVPTSKVVTP